MITDHCNNISSTSTIIKIQCDNVQNHLDDTGQINYNSVAGNQKNDLNPAKINHSNHINIKTTNNNNNNNRTTMSCSPKNDNDNDQNDQSSSNSSSSVATTTTNNTAATKNTTVTNGGSSETNNGSSSNCNGSNRSLKSLIKKKIDPNQDFIKSHNKRVKFSETMQVFCYEEPDNQMPQIIALKPDINLMEFQTYMYDPPAEYQDLLTFEPPPDYRDFIANSLNVFRNEVTFDFIDDDEDSENFDDNRENRNPADYADIKSSFINPNDTQRNSKWQSMILNNNLDSLEEEQIIGVLKEDDILQAIGSQVTLPVNSNESNVVVGIDRSSVVDEHEFQVIDGGHNYDENLSSADFPVHHLNSYFLNTSSHLDDDDEEACCIDSSPNGSLQDLASDSSITSQDTIILINQNKAFHLESVSHPNDDSNNSININENIYENLQPCNNGGRDINNIVTQMVNGTNPTTISQHNPLDNKNITAMEKSPTINDQVSNNSVQEALYENTGELMLSSSNVIVAGAISSAMVSSASTIVGPSSCSSSSSTSSASSAASLVANHVKSFENRLSTSSSEDSRASGSDNENNNPKQSTMNNSLQNNNNNVQFKQNILFYEKMMEQQQNNNNKQNVCKTIIANDQHHLNHQQQNDGMVTVNMQVNVPPPPPPPPSLMATGSQKYLLSSNGTMMPLPCYAILDTSRTSSSSSSSLSSTSSTSSLLVQQPQPALPSSSSASLSSAAQTSSSQSSSTSTFPPLLVTNSVNLQTLAPTTVSSQIKSQGSPQNSNSPVSSISSSTSSSNQPNSNSIMNSEFLSPINQLNNPQQMSVLRKAVQQVNVTIPADKRISGNSNGGGIPSPNNDTTYSNISGPQQQLHGNVPRILTGPHPHLQQQHICIVNNVANNPDGNASQPHQHPPQHQSQLRPGQIVYRYPYALIQPTGMNGVSTIRPLQYIVQATPNNGVGGSPGSVNLNSNPSGQTLNPQSIIYNPKMMVGNQIGGYAISSMPNGSGGSNSSSPSSSSSTTTPSNIPNGNNAIKPGTIIQPAQIVVPNSNETSPNSTNAIPVGRILVQPSGAVLAPRIMQLHHPQHQKHPPPPYQCYVAGQQQQQQRLRQPMVMAYQQHPTNVPIRQTVRCAQYPINNNDLHSQHTEFPHPSEIRRRDGLYAYPQVLIRKDVETNCSSQPSSSSSLNNNNPKLNNDKQTITINTSTDQSTNETDKDELEAFVQQEHQRTERIKKRYSFTEDDDPTFGFARRPSVRGIRPKFGTTNEIIQQITSTMATTKTTNAQQHNQQVRHQLSNHQQQPQQHHPHLICGTLPKNLHHQQSHLQQQQFIQINHPPNNPQILSIVKQIGDMHVGGGGGKNVIVGSPPPPSQQSSAQMHPQLNKSQTLPRQIQHKIIVPKTNNGDAQPNTNNTSNNGNSTTQHEIVRIIDASLLNGPNSGPATASTVTLSRDQLKLHLQRQQAAAVAAQQQQQQQHQKILVAQRGINSGGGGVVVPNHQPSHDTTASTATFSPNHPVTINNNHHHSNNNNNNNNVNNNKSTVSVTTNIKDSTSKPILVTNNNNNNNNENQKDVVYYSLNV